MRTSDLIPDSPIPSKPKSPSSPTEGDRAPVAKVREMSPLAIARQQEKAAVRNTANLRVQLRKAAQCYLDSGFDSRYLPPNDELQDAVKDLAHDMNEAEKLVWGEYYAAPGTVNVMSIAVPDVEVDAIAFFAQPAPQLRIAGGSVNVNG